MKRVFEIVGSLIIGLLVLVPGASAFEIITAEDIKQNIITQEVLVRTADNFVVLVDASGSMDDPYRDGVSKLAAELKILRQQNAILPELGYCRETAEAAVARHIRITRSWKRR